MRWIPIPAALLTFCLSALPVLAQITDPQYRKAPAPKEAMAKPWASLVLIFLLAVLIAVPSFMSSKRGHQD